MKNELKAVVLGTGFAGQGHSRALQYCGVNVVGIVGRTNERVESVAKELGIPYTSTN